jgi:hypothetical protein
LDLQSNDDVFAVTFAGGYLFVQSRRYHAGHSAFASGVEEYRRPANVEFFDFLSNLVEAALFIHEHMESRFIPRVNFFSQKNCAPRKAAGNQSASPMKRLKTGDAKKTLPANPRPMK